MRAVLWIIASLAIVSLLLALAAHPNEAALERFRRELERDLLRKYEMEGVNPMCHRDCMLFYPGHPMTPERWTPETRREWFQRYWPPTKPLPLGD